MVELRTKQREKRVDGVNRDVKLVCRGMLCVSTYTIPDEARMCPNPAGTNTYTSSQTPIHQVVPFIPHVCPCPSYCSHLHSIFLILVHYFTIIAGHKVKSALSISLCYDYGFIWSAAYIYWSIRLVLATGPGNLPVVRFLASRSVQFGSRPGQKPNPLCLGRFVTQTGHKPAGYWPG